MTPPSGDRPIRCIRIFAGFPGKEGALNVSGVVDNGNFQRFNGLFQWSFRGERVGTPFPLLESWQRNAWERRSSRALKISSALRLHFRGLLCAKNSVNTPGNISNSQNFQGASNVFCGSTPVARPSAMRIRHFTPSVQAPTRSHCSYFTK